MLRCGNAKGLKNLSEMGIHGMVLTFSSSVII